MLADRRDEVVGIGLYGPERAGPPEAFHELYRRAGNAGLMRTAHVCEDNQTLTEAPPRNFATCCDVLGCDRLDHGYNLLADPAMVARARDQGLFFNTCSITSVRANLERRHSSIARMVELGLRVTVNTDDPAMFKTDSWATVFARCLRATAGDASRRWRSASPGSMRAGSTLRRGPTCGGVLNARSRCWIRNCARVLFLTFVLQVSQAADPGPPRRMSCGGPGSAVHSSARDLRCTASGTRSQHCRGGPP